MAMKKKYIPLITLLALDLIVVFLHIMLGNSNDFFNLDTEQNFPTIYQGLKLIITSTLAFTLFYILLNFYQEIEIKIKIVWIPWWIIFLFLGLDEVGQLHESMASRSVLTENNILERYILFFTRLGFNSASWLLLYIPIFLIFAVFLFIFLKYQYSNHKDEIIYLIVGVSMFFIVLIIELLNTNNNICSSNMYEKLMILEEFFEMIGASLFMHFIFMMLRKFSVKLNTK